MITRTLVQEPPLFAQDAAARATQIPIYVLALDVMQADIDQATPAVNPLVAALVRYGARQASYAARIVRFDLDRAVPGRDVAAHLGWLGVLRSFGLIGLLNPRTLTAGIHTISWSGFVDDTTYASLLAWSRGATIAPFPARFKAQAMEINPEYPLPSSPLGKGEDGRGYFGSPGIEG